MLFSYVFSSQIRYYVGQLVANVSFCWADSELIYIFWNNMSRQRDPKH